MKGLGKKCRINEECKEWRYTRICHIGNIRSESKQAEENRGIGQESRIYGPTMKIEHTGGPREEHTSLVTKKKKYI